MKVFVATDIRLIECNGRFYIVEAVSTIFRRYYGAFGKIALCCRVVQSDNPGQRDDVTDIVASVIPMRGLASMLLGSEKNMMMDQIENCDLVIGRFHSISACVAADCARKLHKPFFAEVMGDAWDGYWNHGIKGKIIAPYLYLKTKQSIKQADYALYVTSEYLQKRYPCKNESISASNVKIQNLDSEVLERRLAKIQERDTNTVTLMTTAAVDVRYKGQEYVIRAIPKLNRAGLRVRYMLIGGGDQSYLRKVAEKYHVEDQVEFLGRMPLDEVFAKLDEADIYVQPSLQEGLPRSVIEAMSRACPVIGARTAGIPELISQECIVRRKSSKNIADTVMLLTSKAKMSQLAELNFENGKNYLDEVLTKRRSIYFDTIKKDCEK